MSSTSKSSTGESKTVSHPPSMASSAYQRLITTPAIQAMNDNFARNVMRMFGSTMSAATVVEQEQGEETEEEQEVETEAESRAEVQVAPKPYKGKGKMRASEAEVRVQEGVALNPKPWKGNGTENALPQRGLYTTLPPAKAKAKRSPKLRIPARIWNEVVAERVHDGREFESKTSKRDRTDSDSDQEKQRKKRNGTKRQRALKYNSESGQISRVGTASSSRDEPPLKRPARQPDHPPATAVASSSNPYKKQYSNTRRSAPLPRSPIHIKAKPLPRPEPKSALQLPLPLSIPTLSISPLDYEGPRAAWRRLFPGEGEMRDYKGVPDAWHDKMLWQQAEPGRGWRARREDELYVKKVLRFMWNFDGRERIARWNECVEKAERKRVAQLMFVGSG
ncbi:uncharacterized protein ALTATR162_LOCUS188 [Alternaria atra]|uniref:Uncharacterized protein n=1 Tax=Alternaria atra TaxID=119953 RepID=A0A8J2HST7_9PLEO|nr:uncharacterized protein ALTATR162_LOCUS188 [Alternaria atra]CAG5137736.1 unnamed protein product [Alternaria atra]